MKKSINILMAGAFVAATMGLTSCDDFLKENPLDAKASTEFWKTADDAESGVAALYYGGVPYLNNAGGGWQPKATMYGGIISGLYYDDHGDSQLAEASKNCMFNMEKFTSSAMTLWHEFYKGISRANFVLENVPKMTSVLDKATIENYVAQGKFFRAYAYFYLVKEFGDVPYVTKPYTSTEGMFVERTPAAEVYKNIIDELTPLAEGTALPQKSFYDNGCRVTRAMAKTSKEIIYAKEYDYSNQKIGNGYVNHCMGTDATTWKDADGKSLFKMNVMHKTYQPSDIILNSYADNDVRGMEKQFFFKNWTDATGVTHTLDYPGIWAWFEETAITEGTSGDNNIPTMRYAEVLLIAAEGYARTGETARAEGLLNQVRKRAGLPNYSASVNGDLVKAILTERLHEFPVEFKIWDDIRRTRLYPEAIMAGSVQKKDILEWTPLASAKIQNKPVDNVKVGALPEYVLLWPIPQDEMQRNPALEGHQNPGWN